jgi:hypothetical protein
MSRNRVDKLIGEDMELANFIICDSDSDSDSGPTVSYGSPSGTGDRASRAVLREVYGIPSSGGGYSAWSWDGASQSYGYYPIGSGYHVQDWGRKYLSENGGCIYIDLSHIELCIPEVLSAWDAVAAHHAMLRIARAALLRANEKLDNGESIEILVNNSDRLGHSYGSHVNLLVTRRCWDDLFHRKLHPLLVLAAYQVSSIVFTGQGKVGSENGRSHVDYQISQRADFFEVLVGEQTTHDRPLINSRDEALCGSSVGAGSDLARLHCIFYDNTLCHVACLLKVGVFQIVLAMIEAEWNFADLTLDDPVEAVGRYSHDTTLQARCSLVSGEQVTAVELQLRFCEAARQCLAAGLLDTVPRADEILDLWSDTLTKLQRGAFDELVGRLDWVQKRHALGRALDKRPELDWGSPEISHLDLVYSSLALERGLYWAYESAGVAERVVSEAEIDRFVQQPPNDTRAWARAMLLRQLEPHQVESVDWDRVRVRVPAESGYGRSIGVSLDDPLGSTREMCEELFRGAASADALVEALVELSDDGTEPHTDDPHGGAVGVSTYNSTYN